MCILKIQIGNQLVQKLNKKCSLLLITKFSNLLVHGTTRDDNVCLRWWSNKHDAWQMYNKVNNLSRTFLRGIVAKQKILT
jgi:hypothetical protein